MIFVTAGTQKPFDRLIKAMDEIASELDGTDFIVQAFESNYKAKNFKVLNFISSSDFNLYLDKADLVISHAGMGTIISALVKEKPIIVMPRLMKFDEHRSEHQLATAKRFEALGYVNVAYDEEELKTKFLNIGLFKLKLLRIIGGDASKELVTSLRDFINL